MTREKEKELNRIRREMDIYDKAISAFNADLSKRDFSNRFDVDKAKQLIKEKKFSHILECIRKDNKDYVRLNVKGFFGGNTIEVDQEFVQMCWDYFCKKRKELDDEYAKL